MLVLVGLVVYFSLRTDAFFGTENARVIAEFSAPIAIIAAGEVMLLICGEIDLSAGNVYAFSTWIFYFGVTAGASHLACGDRRFLLGVGRGGRERGRHGLRRVPRS